MQMGASLTSARLSDETLLAYYEAIRRQVELDQVLMNRGIKIAFAHGDAVKNRAATLEKQFLRRGLQIRPIDWCI